MRRYSRTVAQRYIVGRAWPPRFGATASRPLPRCPPAVVMLQTPDGKGKETDGASWV